MSNPNTRKSCVVPKCRNTTINSPEKLFFIVPKDIEMRKNWIRAINRLDPFGDKSTVYCCEDHFDVENDMENYTKYKLVGGRIKLKQGTVPHKFQCQQEIEDEPQRSAVPKRNRIKYSEKLSNKDETSTLEKPEEIFVVSCKDEIVIEEPSSFGNNDQCSEISEKSATCKARWGNIRDNFRKSLRKSISRRNRGAKMVKHYKYADHLQFLKKCFDVDEAGDSLAERHVLPGVEVKQEEDSLVQVDFPEPFSDDEDSHCQSPAYTTQKRRKIQDSADQTRSSMDSSPQHYSTQRLEFEQSESVQISNSLSSSVDAFLAGLAPTLKTFSALDWHLAKSELFAVVQKYEFKTIMGEENEQSSLT